MRVGVRRAVNSQELEAGLPSDVGGVFAALSTLFTVQADAPQTVTYTYVDTVDWRLHRAGLALRDARRARAGELVLDSIDASRITTPARPHGWSCVTRCLPRAPIWATNDGIGWVLACISTSIRAIVSGPRS